MTKDAFLKLANSAWRMRFFMLWKLPAAWFMGVKVHYIDRRRAVTALPYGWRSQNPFQSTYFAAQCAAAEMSTGLLAMCAVQGEAPVSMLVIDIRAVFYKKASAPLLFECTEGAEVAALVQAALETGEPQTIGMKSTGRLPDGTVATLVTVTWSFRKKRN